MLGPGVGRRAGPTGVAIEPLAAEALAAVERGADTCDAVAAALDLSGGEAAAALADLEAHGYVTCSLLGTYTRTLLQLLRRAFRRPRSLACGARHAPCVLELRALRSLFVRTVEHLG